MMQSYFRIGLLSLLASLAAVFVMSRNVPGEECCVTRQKRLRGRLATGLFVVYFRSFFRVFVPLYMV